MERVLVSQMKGISMEGESRRIEAKYDVSMSSLEAIVSTANGMEKNILEAMMSSRKTL